jgi:hypothetical protein
MGVSCIELCVLATSNVLSILCVDYVVVLSVASEIKSVITEFRSAVAQVGKWM